MRLFPRNELVTLDNPEELKQAAALVSPLEHFKATTLNIISKLDGECVKLRAEIDAKQKHLKELETVLAAEGLALEHMEAKG